jgi:hypothetical protein
MITDERGWEKLLSPQLGLPPANVELCGMGNDSAGQMTRRPGNEAEGKSSDRQEVATLNRKIKAIT